MDSEATDAIVIRDPAGGANQMGVRDHNERLVLSMIQRHGSLASAEIARRARLSPQTVSVIIRALEAEGLLIKGQPQRGKVGKPLTPVTLDPAGVLSIGVKIGRRSCDLVLMNFTGENLRRTTTTYAYPTPKVVMRFLAESLAALQDDLTPAQRSRVAGIGIAAPFEMWNWLEAVNASPREMDAWRDFDFRAELGRLTDYRIHVINDATAACAAEHFFGRGREFADFAYFFVGYFTGGGVVLNDAVYTGRTGNAGAFGTIPISDTGQRSHQLIHGASLFLLERSLADAGLDPMRIWRQDDDWSGFEAQLGPWIDQTARHLAVATVAVCSVIDFQAVVIEGGFPADIRARLVAHTRQQLAKVDCQGITPPQLLEGSVGAQARVVGAAGLPIFSQFLLNQTGFVG